MKTCKLIDTTDDDGLLLNRVVLLERNVAVCVKSDNEG